MKRSVLAIILAGLVLLTGFGAAVLSLSRPAPVDARAMTAANELVAAGHYAEAAQMYEQLIARGAQDAALYYNLGNAALLLGDAGRAAAAFERAAALAPRDPDIRANRTLAQQQASLSTHVTLSGLTSQLPSRQASGEESSRPTGRDSSPFQPAGGPVNRPSAAPRSGLGAGALGGLADVTGRWLTVDELALVALGAWFALGLLLFAYRAFQPERRPAVVRAALAVTFVVVLVAGGVLAGGVLAGRMAAPRLAAPATTAGQPPAWIGIQQAAAPAGDSNPM